MPVMQNVIHRVEEGGGIRYLKYVLIVLALAVLILSYNLRGFKDMSTMEAMDTAQVARNLADHKGYTTLFIRPFSMYLLQKAYAEKNGESQLLDRTDRSQIKGMHPDLANPPVYPLVLSGLMKMSPKMKFQAVSNQAGSFIYKPDFLISLFNQALFMGAAIMVFLLARRRFDPTVAWISTALFLGTDLFWRFSMSGLSTMLLIVIFIALAWCLLCLEEGYREAKLGSGSLLLLAASIGLLTGLGGLTRYSFGLLIIPVIIFLILFLGRSRVILCLTALIMFTLTMAPWVARNYSVSHTPFGTAGFAMYEGTAYFPDYRLERSLNPDLTRVSYHQLWSKFIGNTRVIMHEDLPKLGGGWIGALFLAGLLVGFRNPGLSRLRYFLLLCLPVLIVAQALGRTQLSEDSPVVNSENLLVLLAPIVIVFGVSFFFTLLDQMDLPVRQLRYLVISVFCALVCLPAIFSLISSRTTISAYPPYYLPIIQKTSGWMKENELMMSDIPWAVAWYGQRQCLWATLGLQTDFFSISDYQKPISAIYLSPVTMDSPFLSKWVHNSDFSWGSFVLEYGILKKPLPGSFPLRKALPNWIPDHFILMDTDRWNQSPAPAAP